MELGSREALNDVTIKAYADENLDSGPAMSDCGDEPMVKGEARKWRNRARIKDNEIKLLRKMVASAKAEVAKKESSMVAMANRLEEVGKGNQFNPMYNNGGNINGNMMALAQRVMVLEQQELPFAREQQRKATLTISHLQNQVGEQERRLRGAEEEHRHALAARDGRIAAQGAAMGALQQRHQDLQQQHQDLQQQHQNLQHQHQNLQQQAQQMRLLVAQLMAGGGEWAGTLGGSAPAPRAGALGAPSTTPERRANTAHLLQPFMPSTWGVAAGVGPAAPPAGGGGPPPLPQQQMAGGVAQPADMALAVAMAGLPQLPSPSRLPAGFSESNSPVVDFLAPRNDAGLAPIPCPTFAAA